MTFGLDPAWKKLTDWAGDNNCIAGLLLLVDTCQLQRPRHPEIGLITPVLDNGLTTRILSSWAEESEICREILKFSRCYSRDTNIQSQYLASTLTVSNRRLLKARERESDIFILRMFRSNQPIEDQKIKRKREIFRLWLLIHTAKRALKGNSLDANIHTACSGLFFSSAESPIHIDQYIFDYDPGTEIPPLAVFDSRIAHRNNLDFHISHSRHETKIMNSLRAIALNESKLRSRHNSDEDNSGVLVSLPSGLKESLQEPKLWVWQSGDADWLPSTPLYNEDDNAGTGIYENEDPSSSYAYQRLSSSTVWLAVAESLYFLPWSWSQLVGDEAKELGRWIFRHLQESALPERFIAACTWLAIHTGRSLVRVLDFRIDESPEKEWTYDPVKQCLIRQRPARQIKWTPDEYQQAWLHQCTDINEIQLPDAVGILLQDVISVCEEQPPRLGHCWETIQSEDGIDTAFNRLMTDRLSRIKSGMLGNQLAGSIYDKEGNPNLARMCAYHPQAGLPGKFAYGSWDAEHVDRLLNSESSSSEQSASTDIIAMGSQLRPIEEKLVSEIQQAGAVLEEYRLADNPIAFFNRYLAYVTVALWAGTGARPVHDSFESPEHFHLDAGYVYVNDKAEAGKHGGHLHPLPTQLIQIIREQLPQLYQVLAKALKSIHPDLSHEIALLATGKVSEKIPFLFFLNEEDLTWQSISESSIEQLGLFTWPLPMRMWRHRFIQQASHRGIDIDTINGWMNHGDPGYSPYDHYSPRSRQADIDTYRDIVDEMFNELGFQQVALWRKPPHVKIQTVGKLNTRTFGIAYRKKQRDKTHKHVVSQTSEEIDEYLGDRTLDQLSEEELDTLTLSLIMRSKGLPRRYAALRYSVLSKRIDDLWNEAGIKLHIKRRAIHFRPDPMDVPETTPLAHTLFPTLQQRAIRLMGQINVAQTSKIDCRLYALIALALENRISYASMLLDIYQGRCFRIVYYRRQYYVEYSEHVDHHQLTRAVVEDSPLPNEIINAPVQRLRITSKTANLLCKVALFKHSPYLKREHFPEPAQPLVNLLNERWPNSVKTHEEFIKQLCLIVEQVNQIQLPCIMASILAGTTRSSSLRWNDWIRLRENRVLALNDKIAFPEESNKNEIDQLLGVLSTHIQSVDITDMNDSSLQEFAGEFVSKINNILKSYSSSKPRDTINSISATRKEFQTKVSSTLLLLSDWINDRIERGRFNSNITLADTTPYRYFSELGPDFAQLGYQFDIHAAEKEDLTSFYEKYLAANQDKANDYHAKRLESFHSFAVSKGITDPEWGDLNIPLSTRVVSPGVLTEQDYLQSLKVLIHLKQYNPDQCYQMAFLLLVCYRFGLRPNEAFRLRRGDWRDDHSDLHVLVYRHPEEKRLKTIGSRRVVPCLFDLSTLEQDVIHHIIGNCESRYQGDLNAALFTEGETNDQDTQIDVLKQIVIQVLKQVTGNPLVVLYDARHTFCNTISLALLNSGIPSWQLLSSSIGQSDQIRQTALGAQQQLSRRTTTVIARLMGNTTPKTSITNYQHFYGDWIDQYLNVGHRKTKKVVEGAINLDEWERTKRVSISCLEAKPFKYYPTDMVNLIKTMALVGGGKSFKNAAQTLSLDPNHVTQLEVVVRQIGSRIRLPAKSGKPPVMGEQYALEFLTRIKHNSWPQIIKTIQAKQKPLTGSPESLLPIDEIYLTVGATRQLTLWTPKHFFLLKSLLDYFAIKPENYSFCELKPDSEANQHATNAGLTPSTLDTAGKNGRPLIADGKRREKVTEHDHARDHCVFSFARNRNFWIGNSYEFLVVYIAYLVSTEFTTQTDKNTQ